MITPRHCLTCVLVLWTFAAHAQDGTGTTSTSSSSTTDSTTSGGAGTGASSAFGGGSSSGSSAPAVNPFTGGATPFSSDPAGTPTAPGAGNSATGFGTGIGTGTPAQSGQSAATAIPLPAKPLDSGPSTFSISTGYGKAPEVFVSGEGRLARPKFQTRVSASIGFDDNIFQTPTDAKGTPDQVFEQQVTAGSDAQIVTVLVPARSKVQGIGIISNPNKPTTRQVYIPAVEPEFEKIVIPGTPKPKRQASAISRESVGFEAQTSTKRSVFTADFSLNSDYYWNRPSKKAEYNGSLAVRYLYRFSARLQATASLDFSYLSQPDLSQINTPTNTGNGNYLVTSGKTDVSYRWTQRFSTVASLSYNRLDYEEKEKQVGNYNGFTLGLELRYLWSPKLTAVLEGRYGHTSYPNSPGVDASSIFALTGFDLALSRRTAMTLRVGEVTRRFDDSGKSASAPYLETSLNYQLGKASVLSWGNRFGFEEPPDENTKVLVLRSNLSVTHFFGPRLRGSLGITGIHRSSTSDLTDTDVTENDLQSNISLLYTLTRDWEFNLNYNYTAVFFEKGEGDYFRDSIFAGLDYSF